MMLCPSQPTLPTHTGCHASVIHNVPRPPHHDGHHARWRSSSERFVAVSFTVCEQDLLCCAYSCVPQPSLKLVFQPQLHLRALAVLVQRVGKDRQQLQQPAVQGKGPQLHRVTAVQQQIICTELASHQRKECKKTPLLNVKAPCTLGMLAQDFQKYPKLDRSIEDCSVRMFRRTSQWPSNEPQNHEHKSPRKTWNTLSAMAAQTFATSMRCITTSAVTSTSHSFYRYRI